MNGSVDGFVNPVCPYDMVVSNSSMVIDVSVATTDDYQWQVPTHGAEGNTMVGSLFDFSLVRTSNGSHLIYGGRSIYADKNYGTGEVLQ